MTSAGHTKDLTHHRWGFFWTVQSTFFTAAALAPSSLVAVKTDKDFFQAKSSVTVTLAGHVV